MSPAGTRHANPVGILEATIGAVLLEREGADPGHRALMEAKPSDFKNIPFGIAEIHVFIG